MAAAGGVCLVVAIALAVVVIKVKKRFKAGALADRKYVKEENDDAVVLLRMTRK